MDLDLFASNYRYTGTVYGIFYEHQMELALNLLLHLIQHLIGTYSLQHRPRFDTQCNVHDLPCHLSGRVDIVWLHILSEPLLKNLN